MRAPADRPLAGALYEAMTFAARYPFLALPAARVLGHGIVVDRDTDVVIEGYPRSGNSFAVAAFAQAQPRPIRIAHHTHAPANVLTAARLGVPALVVVRDPEEAAVEFALVKQIGIVRALRGYASFHEALLPRRDGFVVGEFGEVTTDLGPVIRRVNARFGTSFAEFRHTDDAVRESEEVMEAYWAGREGPGIPVLGRTSAGADPREADRSALRERLDAPEHARLLERARRAYRTVRG